MDDPPASYERRASFHETDAQPGLVMLAPMPEDPSHHRRRSSGLVQMMNGEGCCAVADNTRIGGGGGSGGDCGAGMLSVDDCGGVLCDPSLLGQVFAFRRNRTGCEAAGDGCVEDEDGAHTKVAAIVAARGGGAESPDQYQTNYPAGLHHQNPPLGEHSESSLTSSDDEGNQPVSSDGGHHLLKASSAAAEPPVGRQKRGRFLIWPAGN